VLLISDFTQKSINTRKSVRNFRNLIIVWTLDENIIALSTIMDSDSKRHFLSNQRIIIAGGGISGLAFAIGIHRQWHAFADSTSQPPHLIIYERDTHADAIGRQGYSMSLRSDPPGGLQALQKLGILDRVLDVSVIGREEQGGFALWDRGGKEILKVKATAPKELPVGGARIARKKLREVLIDAVGETGIDIVWNTAVIGIEKADNGRMKAILSDGKEEIADFIVAADGSHSKLRSIVRPADNLQYLGVHCLNGTAKFENSPPKPVDTDWGMVLTGHSTSVFISPVDAHSALWSIGISTPEPREKMKSPLSTEDYEKIMQEVQNVTAGFPSPLPQLLEATDPETVFAFNAMDKQPFSHELESTGNIVFIGDANHAVSPFAGNGANMALVDAWDLAEKLCNSSSFSHAVSLYDIEAVPRAKKVISTSHFTITVAHATGWRHYMYVWLVRSVAWLFTMIGTLKR
jgi:2-polyprenyl-6-methoxyphenol hydroxylase-like FAD-dependent oxidoreductase